MQVVDLSEVRTPETPTEVESEQSWYREEIAIKTPSFEDETSQPDDASSAASAASVSWKEASWHRMVNELLLRETQVNRCFCFNLKRGSATAFRLTSLKALRISRQHPISYQVGNISRILHSSCIILKNLLSLCGPGSM